MVHYRLPFKENWNKEMRKILVEELSKKLGIEIGIRTNDGVSPYIEFDEDSVRIRRLTHLSEKEQNKIMKNAEVIYKSFEDGEENVKKTLKELTKTGMIEGEKENNIRLTEKGNKVAEEFLGNLNPIEKKIVDEQMRLAGKKVWTCPRCKKETEDIPAISRKDNKTEICTDCGTEEGLIPEYLNKGYSLEDAEKEARKVVERIRSQEKRLDELENKTYHTNLSNEEIKKILQRHPNLKATWTDEADYTNPLIPLNIPENDRLINYQVLKGFAERVYLTIDRNKLIENPYENKEIYLMDYWLSPVLENGMVFQVEDEDIGMALLNDYFEGESSFQTMIIDCKFPIGEKTFYCLGVGSYYTENKIHYRAVTTCYEKDGKMYLAMFALDKTELMEDNGFNLTPKEVKQLRSVVFGCFNLFNEQDVKMIDRPENPKNNIRRREKGRITLPSFKIVRITGELKQYSQRIATGIKRRGYNYKFWVRGTYMHFFDKKKHKRLYAMKEDETELFKERTTKNKDGSIQKWRYKKDKNGIIIRWRRAFEKGEGLHIKQMYKYGK